MSSRKARGAKTQALVAVYLADRWWPYATDAGAGRSGVDILGVPGLAIEVKARRDLNLLAWLRQASENPGLPMVIHRPDGMGEKTIDQWPVTLRLGHMVELLHAAGYGGDDPGDSR